MTQAFSFFTDPVLMAPTIGCMLMCLVGAVIGTFAILKKQALVGEMLSHACYPGVIFALIFFTDCATWVPLVGATLSCAVGMYLVELLQHRFKATADAALCFVLASFFGIGLTVLTAVQTQMPLIYRQLQSYLFGQAATITEEQLWLYIILTIVVLVVVVVFYRLLTVSIFDPEFAEVLGMNTALAQFLLVALIVLAVVIGIRSLGVVLMSSMLIFPGVCARFWTHKMKHLLALAAFFGLLFGFFGVYLSHNLSVAYAISFPTGPACVVVATLVFLFSALFSPERGLIVRMIRAFGFWNLCQQENLLKAMYKCLDNSGKTRLSRNEIQALFHENRILVSLLLFMLKQKKWLTRGNDGYFELTPAGLISGRKIVRLHRLWEVYLVEYCGVAKERVHPSAEEMEHSLTKEIERELETMLHHPQVDPHRQPIPPPDEVVLQ